MTDPDSRSMATSGRGSGVVGYNVQVAVDTEHHLIVTHEVTNSSSDRAQLANMARQAKAVLKTETLEAVADRGYFSSPEILACHEAGIVAPTLILLLLARFVQGASAAMLMPNSLAILGQSFSGEAKGRAIGIWAARCWRQMSLSITDANN
jgi:hypothetical protein